MEQKIADRIKMIYFMIFAVMFYYFITEVLSIGLVMTFRHVFALLIVFSAIVCFLYTPNIARGATAVKDALIYSLPLPVTIVVSLFIWFVTQVDTSVITRGISTSFIFTNMISFSLAAAAILYIFGEKGIWYNLIAILVANILMIGTIILENGFGPYFSEFITLIVTFAAETGDIIIQAEVHELAFCLGAYLIYMVMYPKKKVEFFILLALTLFCFLSAFKRIAMIAIAVAVVFAFILRFIAKYKKDTADAIIKFISILLVVILIAYVGAIKLGVFDILEKMGIETSGRVEIYSLVDKYYDFSAEFLGNGIGFLTYELNTNTKIGVAAVHNDFLQYFIDLGFWGYLLWLLSIVVLRIFYFSSKGKTDSGILVLALTIYLLIVSSTDNTMNYPLLTTVIAVLMIGHGFDEKVRITENKMFGCVSEANKQNKGGFML